jgi:hypothetical protein
MPTQQKVAQPADSEEQGVRRRDSLIEGQVILALGQPNGLHRVQVRPLWEHHFRVNVLIGPDAVSAKIAHSYFLVTDGRGTVVASTPKIVKQY